MLADKFTLLKGEVVSASEVFDLISTRQVPFEMIKDIFTEMTSEGGKFYKMQEKQAETLAGKISNLKDKFQIMNAEIGTKGDKILKGAIDATSSLMANYEHTGRVLIGMVGTYGAYRAALALTTKYGVFDAATKELQVRATLKLAWANQVAAAKQALLNSTLLSNPFVAVTALVVGLGFAMWNFYKAGTQATKTQQALNDVTEEYNKSINSEMNMLNSLYGRMSRAEKGTKEYEEAKSAIIRQFGKYHDGLNEELNRVNGLSTAYLKLKDAVLESAKARAMDSATEKASDLFAEVQSRSGDKIIDILKKRYGEINVESIYGQLREYIEGGELTKEAKDIIDMFETSYVSAQGVAGQAQTYSINILESEINKIREAKNVFEGAISKAALKFGSGTKETVDKTVDAITYSTDKQLMVALDAAKKKLSELQDQARQGIIPVDKVEEQRDVVEKITKDLAAMGVELDKNDNKSSDKEKQKEREEEVKRFLNGVQAQVDEYRKKFNIYNKLYESTGEKPDIDFGLTFDGEPDLVKYIKEKMRQVGGKGLKLDVDFLTADFGDILQGATFDDQTMTKLKALFDELRDIAGSEFESMENLYSKYATYTQNKAKLDRKYIEERRKLIENNVEAQVLAEHTRIYKEESDRLVTEFAEKDRAFNDFVASIANQSVDRLRFLLMQLQATLTQETAKGASDDTIAMLKAKIAALEEELRSAQKNLNSKDNAEDSYKKWKQLQSVLGKVNKSFDEIGDSVGGLGGEIISLAGDITTSTLEMINGITELANWSIQSTKMTAEGVSKSIQAVERASVILAVISAALQIATKIWSLVSKSSEISEKTIKQYQALVKATNDVTTAQKELIATLSGMDAQREYEKTLAVIRRQVAETIKLGKEYMNSGETLFKSTYGYRNQKELKKYAKDIEGVLGVSYKSLGTRLEGLFDLSVDQLKALRELTWVWAALDDDVRGYLESLIELDDKTNDLLNTTKEAFTGTEFDEIMNGLDDFIISADSDFSMLAENFEKYMSNAMLNIVKTQYLTKALKGWADDFSEMMSDGALSEAEKTYLENLYKTIAEEGKRRYDAAKEAAGVSDTQTNLQGIAKSAASITEDTALILGGYLDSIRLAVIPSSEYLTGEFRTTMNQFTVYQSQMVGYLASIDANTKRSANASANLAENIGKVMVAEPDGWKLNVKA